MGWEELQCDPMSLCCATALLAVIGQDVFGDPKITIADDSPDSEALSCSTEQRDLDVVSTAYHHHLRVRLLVIM
jgi:hypothetical protein